MWGTLLKHTKVRILQTSSKVATGLCPSWETKAGTREAPRLDRGVYGHESKYEKEVGE
jgi:hypothetical protein